MNEVGIRLEMTCQACPEQYDAFVEDELVAYLRLRHGTFTVEMPDAGGTLVYSARTNGDGAFDESEREHHLRMAKEAITRSLSWCRAYPVDSRRPRPSRRGKG